MRYDVFLEFVIMGQNLENGQNYFLSLDEDTCIFPSAEFSGNIDRDILKPYLNIDLAWINLKLKSLYVNQDKLYLVCTGRIPLQTQLKDSYWLELNKANELQQKMIQGTI